MSRCSQLRPPCLGLERWIEIRGGQQQQQQQQQQKTFDTDLTFSGIFFSVECLNATATFGLFEATIFDETFIGVSQVALYFFGVGFGIECILLGGAAGGF